jgi:drug/metabolite transporter (DMT)-like permease
VSRKRFPRLWTVFQALFVTFLWSTSWVLIKIGLEDIPALTFAGLRYSLAFVCLLPFAMRSVHLKPLRYLSSRGWARLVVLGLLFYAVTQGAQFIGLAYLPAVTVSLLLNFTTIVVALAGIPLLAERPTALQWCGVIVNVIGIAIYFWPVSIPAGQVAGLIVVAIGVLANAGSSILGRRVNRDGNVPALTVTVVSMGVGAAVLLASGILIQGFPPLSPIHWAIIGWLAVVNTAFAFTLWNHTLRTLSATESSIINSTMLVQIATLAWLFLGERLTWQEIAGMALAGIGALIVQLRRQTGLQ